MKEDIFFSNTLESAIKDSIASGSKIIQFNKITTFNWDKLIIGTPYIKKDSITYYLGFYWTGINYLDIEQSDSYNLILFSRNDTVVSYTCFPRDKGDFSKISKKLYNKNNSTFIIKVDTFHNPDTKWIYLKDN